MVHIKVTQLVSVFSAAVYIVGLNWRDSVMVNLKIKKQRICWNDAYALFFINGLDIVLSANQAINNFLNK
ncbi:hypothetical protein ASS79_05225 [Staphylococcus saprophyticus]|nr:hypothetical protein CEQ14_04015 [Staphylococcus saprophyticus]OEK11348.1 hypothetical protein ASS79_05225 [Staphylococcus saprophyticus]OEK26101.1 hypothetical protein ASS85_07595 [Staphylococcus saprophyticus]OEK30238.1 hypothetical protein ASS84_00045 [Staphylococcus saprophyticus]OLN88832.1 hypothetical protein BMJ01_11625 [Staphylococcus saprophyticus]